MIKRFKRRHLGLLPPPPSSNFETLSSVQLLINSLCPPSSLHKTYFSLDDFSSSSSSLPCTIFNDPFSLDELQIVINNLRIRSSPGLDMIDYQLISLLSPQYLRILLDILNSILDQGTFPSSWSHSLVFLIPKSSPNKFRPISLTSCTLKLLERLILSRLDWWVEKNHFLPPYQSSFRKNRSCQDNLGILFSEIYKGFAKGYVTICVFLDIAGAFDNVIPNLLIKDLIEMGIPPKVCVFIYNIICCRELQFVINGSLSNTCYTYKGVTQGSKSILSPFLFNIYVSKIHNYISKDCQIVQFVDDIAIFISCPSSQIKLSSKKLEASLSRLSKYLSFKGLNISPEKSALMTFSRTKSTPVAPLIELNGHVIRSVPSFRFLGIFLDPKLLGHSHINFLTQKANKLIKVIRSLCGTWWGSDPKLLLAIYKSLIRGSIEYGCQFLPT